MRRIIAPGLEPAKRSAGDDLKRGDARTDGREHAVTVVTA